MRSSRVANLNHYLLAIVAVGAVAALRLALSEYAGQQARFLFFAASVVVAALWGGLGPGLFATVLSAVTIDVLFLPPYYSIAIYDGSDLLSLGLYVAQGVLISWLGESNLRALRSLEDLNAEIEQRVVTRTGMLSRSNEALNEQVLENERITADLRVFADHLQRSNRELEEFASVASHDLQEPLRKIQAFGDRLKTTCGNSLSEDGRDYLARMQNAAKRMQTLINDLLTFSRVTTQAQPFRPTDLGLLAAEVASDLEARVEQTGAAIQIGELPTIEADPLQMRQLFQNLISNGLKFRQPDVPPRVSIVSRLLDQSHEGLNSGDYSQRCEITFEDNGIGFDEKYLDRIFDVFQRLHSRAEFEGTGIGLAVCRKIVERHNGSITARSRPGEGASFIVTLPIKQDSSEVPDVAATETDNHSAGR